jgi:hypothetical protein
MLVLKADSFLCGAKQQTCCSMWLQIHSWIYGVYRQSLLLHHSSETFIFFGKFEGAYFVEGSMKMCCGSRIVEYDIEIGYT